MSDDATPMRWAVAADADRIADYHHACWQQVFKPLVSPEVMLGVEPRLADFAHRFSDASDFTTVVAVGADDVPIGHTTVRGSELVHLFVDPAHHGKGLGRQLLAVGERLIRRAGHDHAQLHTIVGNVRAIALYQSCGWTLTDETEDDHLPNGSSYTEHIMRKPLAGRDHVAANRETWDDDAPNWVERGRRSWSGEPHWGEMSVADSVAHALPDVAGKQVIELGCGTGYVSAWCMRAGAAGAVGVDNSRQQLRGAQLLQREFNLSFPLVWTDAEQLPMTDNSFDVAVSEYGAALWCDPRVWIPEAARVLRPGGSLMFLAWSTLMSMVAPDFEQERTATNLRRPQRDLHQVTFPDTEGVEFALSHGAWIELLTANGFRIDRLIELYAPDEGGPERYSYYDASWARRWPPEEIWCCTYLPA